MFRFVFCAFLINIYCLMSISRLPLPFTCPPPSLFLYPQSISSAKICGSDIFICVYLCPSVVIFLSASICACPGIFSPGGSAVENFFICVYLCPSVVNIFIPAIHPIRVNLRVSCILFMRFRRLYQCFSVFICGYFLSASISGYLRFPFVSCPSC